jgi:hypothetical protein
VSARRNSAKYAAGSAIRSMKQAYWPRTPTPAAISFVLLVAFDDVYARFPPADLEQARSGQLRAAA